MLLMFIDLIPLRVIAASGQLHAGVQERCHDQRVSVLERHAFVRTVESCRKE